MSIPGTAASHAFNKVVAFLDQQGVVRRKDFQTLGGAR